MFFCGSLIILLTLFEYGISRPGQTNFYWRPFDGKIPFDATVGHGNKGNEVFTGNFPVWHGGRSVYMGEVRESVKKFMLTHADTPHIQTDNKQFLYIINPELLTKKTDTTTTEGTTTPQFLTEKTSDTTTTERTTTPQLLTEKTDTTTNKVPTTTFKMQKWRGGN